MVGGRLVGAERSSLAGIGVNVVETILIPQSEAIVVEAAGSATEHRGPLRLSFMNNTGGEGKVVEASVVALAECTRSSRVGRTNPDIEVSLVVVFAAHVSSHSSVNVNLVVWAAIVESIEQLRVSCSRFRDLGSRGRKRRGFTSGEVWSTKKAFVRAEGQVDVDFDVLDKVGGKGSGLVHLEVKELELHAVVEVLASWERRGPEGWDRGSWSKRCALSEAGGEVCTGWNNDDGGTTGRKCSHSRKEKCCEDEHFLRWLFSPF